MDGVPEMLAAVRENLRHGASQIKLATRGGYASPSDPLMVNQFTFEEIKAAVDAAADWQTYVTVHAYHPSSINRAIDAGIKDVGHGQLLGEGTPAGSMRLVEQRTGAGGMLMATYEPERERRARVEAGTW